MNTNLKLLIVGVCGLAIGISSSNFATSSVVNKVAVVDVQKVVSSSKQVETLKNEQKKKIEEITAFVNKARADVSKESDDAKKKALEEKYNKEFASKRANIEKEYAAKLAQIDKSISSVIESSAKKEGYNLVLAKGMVLYGGTDITSQISKDVK